MNITGTSLHLNANQEGAIVVKLTALLEATNDGPHSLWHESAETFNIIIDKQPFDNGRTKKIFKVISLLNLLFCILIVSMQL
jgi:hypothetical protein